MWLANLAKFAAGTNYAYKIVLSIVLLGSLLKKLGERRHG